MSAELTLSMRMSLRKGEVDVPPFGASGVKLDVSGSRFIRNTQLIGTTQEALILGELTDPGYGIFHNLSTSNTIYIRRATGEGDMIKLRPGGWACFELEATAPYAVSTSSASYLEYLIVDA